MHRGELRWECFCKHHCSSPESRSQIIDHQLPPGILRHRPPSQHSTVVTVQ